jgi:hypothetical protein
MSSKMGFAYRKTPEAEHSPLPAQQTASTFSGYCRIFLMNAGTPHRLGAAPVLVQNRPEGLVEILTVSKE